MLNKINNQENIIGVFFVVALIGVGIYVFVDKSIIDIIYLVVLGYYFMRFLMVRCRR